MDFFFKDQCLLLLRNAVLLVARSLPYKMLGSTARFFISTQPSYTPCVVLSQIGLRVGALAACSGTARSSFLPSLNKIDTQKAMKVLFFQASTIGSSSIIYKATPTPPKKDLFLDF